MSDKILIEKLQELEVYLTSKNPTERKSGLEKLLDFISNLSLSIQSKLLLIQYYQARLDDHECLDVILKGLLVLPADYGVLVALVKIDCKSLSVNERNLYLTLVSNIIQRHTAGGAKSTASDESLMDFDSTAGKNGKTQNSTTKGIESEVIGDLVWAVEGEKDPRNLLLLFTIFTTLIPLSPNHLINPIYQLLSVYFPISFTPPKNDKIGITPQHLKSALKSVLISDSRISDLILPECLLKLSSSFKDAQLDSMDLLVDGLPVFGFGCLKKYYRDLWKNCKFLLTSDDQHVRLLALKLVVTMSSMFSTFALRSVVVVAPDQHSEGTVSVTGNAEEEFKNYLELVYNDCIGDIKSEKYSMIVSGLFSAISATSTYAFDFMHSKLSSFIYQDSDFIHVLADILVSNRLLHKPDTSPMFAFKSKIFELVQSTYANPTLKPHSLKCMHEMLLTDGFLTVEEQGVCFMLICNSIDFKTRNDLASHYLKEFHPLSGIKEFVLPWLFERLNDERVYNLVVVVCKNQSVLEVVLAKFGDMVRKKSMVKQIYESVKRIIEEREYGEMQMDSGDCVRDVVYLAIGDKQVFENVRGLKEYLDVVSIYTQKTQDSNLLQLIKQLNHQYCGSAVPFDTSMASLYDSYYSNINLFDDTEDLEFLLKFVQTAVTKDEEYLDCSGRVCMSFINKTGNEKESVEKFGLNYGNPAQLRVLAWIVKGLVIKNYSLGFQLAETISSSGVPLSDFYKILCKDINNPTLTHKLITKQKLFQKLYPIVRDLQTVDALECNLMLQEYTLYKYVEDVSFIVTCLKREDMLNRGLMCVQGMLENQSLLPYVDNIIDTILQHIAKFNQGNGDYKYNTRVLCLKLLGDLSKLAGVEKKDGVLRGCALCLEDWKRGVRVEAARCRTMWFLK